MNWKSFITGFSSGILGGFLAYHYISKSAMHSPESILEKVKTTFKERGQISGSWIQTQPESYEANSIKYKVYKGGISQIVDGETKQHEFIADATTGTILSFQLIS